MLPLQPGQKVLIVGAGVAGLQLARALDKQSIPYTIVEECREVGGVWRSNYSGYSTQITTPGYEFPEFPHPKELGLKWADFPSGQQVKQYIELYTDHFGLRSKIRFNTKLLCAKPFNPTGIAAGWGVVLREGGEGGAVTEEEYAYLAMATGLNNCPSVPRHYQDLSAFAGPIVTGRHMEDASAFAGKNVLVVGGNKTALGCSESIASAGGQATLLFRRAHWILPYWTLGFVPIFALFARVFAWLLPPFYTASPLQARLHALTKPLKYLHEASLQWAIRLTTGVSGDLLPTTPLVSDVFAPAAFAADQSFFSLIREGAIRPVKGDVARFKPTGVQLIDGRTLEGFDAVVLATGYANDFSWLPPDVEQRLGVEEDGLYLYRHVLPPRVPGLAFVGNQAYTLNAVVTSGLQSEWLARALKGSMALPGVGDQEADVAALKQYKRSWMPASNKRASTVALHDIYYHDQLVEDMGFTSHVHGWNLLAEGFMPYIAGQYRHVFRASAEEAAGVRKPLPARPHKIQRPTSAIQPPDKVEFPYGGFAADTLIKKGVLSNPLETTKGAHFGSDGKAVPTVVRVPVNASGTVLAPED